MPVARKSSEGGVEHFLISNGSGVEISCISLGATITAIKLPDGYYTIA